MFRYNFYSQTTITSKMSSLYCRSLTSAFFRNRSVSEELLWAEPCKDAHFVKGHIMDSWDHSIAPLQNTKIAAGHLTPVQILAAGHNTASFKKQASVEHGGFLMMIRVYDLISEDTEKC